MTQSNRTKFCHGCQAELPVEEKRCPYCHERQQSAFELKFFGFFKKILPGFAPATFILLAANIISFIIIAIDIMAHPDYNLMNALMAPPGEIIARWGAHVRGELSWWRLVTANFIHFGLLHIGFNGYALKIVGPYVERAYGSCLTFAAFVILGTGSMLCSNLWGAPGLVAGASGGLMAFIGMATSAAHRENTQLSLEIRNSMLKWAAATFVFGIIVSMTDSMGVDNIAHVSGFLLGILVGWFLPRQSTTGYTHLWMIRTTRCIALIALAICCTAFTWMVKANASLRYQNECIAEIKLQKFSEAQKNCEKAYELDQTQTISYHNYILINLINGNTNRAKQLCIEGRNRFDKTGKETLSFDEMCRSINPVPPQKSTDPDNY